MAAMDISTLPMPASPASTSSRSLSRKHSHNLSLDLSDLPQLSEPTPPSNTLLITNLQAPEIFAAANLDGIQRAINDHAPIHTFSPLKSFRRVIVTFYNTEDAITIRQVLDGEFVLGNRVRVYFGQETSLNLEDQHLQAPKSNKLFFISPPPSPPMGWEMRDEEPPNKEVHAEDLATALSRLHARPSADDALYEGRGNEDQPISNRQRSGSTTLVYHPEDHGHSPDLPAIAVEDTTEEPEDAMEGVDRRMFTHTARPPVELM